jgi:hypothetical protein
VFGLNLTLAALMVYLMLRHAGRTPGLAADDVAEVELQAFAKERRSAVLLQAGATVVGAFLPLTTVVFYLLCTCVSTPITAHGTDTTAVSHLGPVAAAAARSDALPSGWSRDVGSWCGFGGWEHDGGAEADQADEGQDDHGDPVGPAGVG